jgi:hypothetical protein
MMVPPLLLLLPLLWWVMVKLACHMQYVVVQHGAYLDCWLCLAAVYTLFA